MFAFLKKIDLDDLFAYETFKTVIVRDRRLGLLHYFFILIIFIYITYSIITNQLYLVKDSINSGAIRLTAYPPSSFPDQFSYCSNNCIYLGASDVAKIQDSSIFIYTRVSITNATLTCPIDSIPTSKTCIPSFPKANRQVFYVAGIENYTLMLEHSVHSFLTNMAVRNLNLKGSLLNYKGDLLKIYLPSNASESDRLSAKKEIGQDNIIYRDPTIPGDIITIQDLIRASGLATLDVTPSSSSSSSSSDSTIRYDGTVIMVSITYSNRMSSYDDVKYSYRVGYIPGADAKHVVNRLTSSDTVLQEWNYHGLHIRFVQTGYMGKFEFMALLQALVASVALLGVAKILVEQLMLRALKERKAYKEYKYEITEDFSERSTTKSNHSSKTMEESESNPSQSKAISTKQVVSQPISETV